MKEGGGWRRRDEEKQNGPDVGHLLVHSLPFLLLVRAIPNIPDELRQSSHRHLDALPLKKNAPRRPKISGSFLPLALLRTSSVTPSVSSSSRTATAKRPGLPQATQQTSTRAKVKAQESGEEKGKSGTNFSVRTRHNTAPAGQRIRDYEDKKGKQLGQADLGLRSVIS